MTRVETMLAALCVMYLCLAVGGCPPRSAAPQTAPRLLATAPAAPATQASNVYDNPKYGVQLTEPVGYSPTPSTDYELLLVPPGSPATPIDSLSLEIPDLPIHVPGLIPLKLVVNGYVDDLKTSHPNLAVEQNQAYTVSSGKAWIVQSHWPDGKTTDTESAILIVHGDHVFILRGNSDADGRTKTLQAFDQFAKSLQWAK
jgi:hypothetical protein